MNLRQINELPATPTVGMGLNISLQTATLFIDYCIKACLKFAHYSKSIYDTYQGKVQMNQTRNKTSDVDRMCQK